MNVQKDQIQALIAEIDEVLNQPSLRLPWVVFGETVTRSRQVLERVRHYLIALEQEADTQVGIIPSEPNQPLSGSLREPLWQAIRREMVYLRTHLTQPLQDEVDHLRQEQRSLMQEIQQLEARKAQILVSIQPQAYQQQLSREFLQELMTRLQDTLIQNVTETLSHIETRFLDSILLPEANSAEALPALPEKQQKVGASNSQLSTRLTPAQRLEQMRQLQAQSDHLLMTLDSSLSVIFEALQRNLQTYSDSLEQSIERMHSLGQQGEVMFTSWVNQLAEHVGEETSSYLQSSLQLTTSEEVPTPLPMVAETLPVIESPEPELEENAQTEELLPYAGVEFPRRNYRVEDAPLSGSTQSETWETETEELNFDELAQSIEDESDSRLEVEQDSLPIEAEAELTLPLDLGEGVSESEAESAFSGLFSDRPMEAEFADPAELALPLDLGEGVSESEAESAFSGLFSDRPMEAEFAEPDELNEASSDLEFLFATSPEKTQTPNQSEAQQLEIDLFNEDEEVVTTIPPNTAQTEEELVLNTDIQIIENKPTQQQEPTWNPEDLFNEDNEAVTTIPPNTAQTEEELVLNTDIQIIENEPTQEQEPTWEPEDLLEPELSSEVDGDRLDVQTEDVALESLNQDLFLENTDSTALAIPEPNLELEQMATPQTVELHPFEETLADFSDIFEEPNLEEVPFHPNAGIVSARTQQELTQSFSPAPEPTPPRPEHFEMEDYIPASQDENLLPQQAELDSDQMDTHLMIDRNTIEQLEADLFNLEQQEPSFSPSRSNPKASTKPERSVSTAVAQPRTQPSETKSVRSRPEEVITFDDLFKELGMESRSAHSFSSAQEQLRDHALEVKTFSDLTLDDVFESFDLATEAPLGLESETEEPLSLETLGEEIWNSQTNPVRGTKKRMKS